jgi:hypothetical protein
MASTCEFTVEIKPMKAVHKAEVEKGQKEIAY